MKDYKYKFSVIIPIYNVEKYVEEAILSVINQTIGFENNIQMILVNDGSLDNSEKICKKYEQKYPNNIKYIYQENQGVSAARNTGKKFAEGKYINYLDADDKWDLDVFEKAYDFFEKHYEEVDLIACRIKVFGVYNKFHRLDYKFYENHISDITKDYTEIQLHLNATFIKEEIAKLYDCDTRLHYAEDSSLIGRILMEKSKYGILVDAIYNYRKRDEKDSALQTKKENKNWYFAPIEYAYKMIIEKSIKKYGKVIPYFQYYLMYEITWKISVDISQYFSKEEQKKFVDYIIEILQYIEDDIILEQKFLKRDYKILALCLKYKKDVRKEFYYKDSKIYFNDTEICSIKGKNLCTINEIRIESKKLYIKGKISYLFSKEDYEMYIRLGTKEKIDINNYVDISERTSIVGNLNDCREFNVIVPIKNNTVDLKFVIDYKSNKKTLKLTFGQMAKLSTTNNNLFFIDKKYAITTEKNKIFINKVNSRQANLMKQEYIKFLKENSKSELIDLRNKVQKKRFKCKKIYIKFVDEDMYVMNTFKKWKDNLINLKKWKKIEDTTENKKIYILLSSIVVGKPKDIKDIFLEDEEYIKDLYNFKYIS